MKHHAGRLLVALAFLPAACGRETGTDGEYVQDRYRIRLERRADSLSVLRLYVDGTERDSMRLPYPVYRFDCGDLTGDGLPEVCVGVVKPTRYWPEGRRLFIYHLHRGRYIRPLWLGSRVGRPLVDFRVCRDSVPACIHTVERGADSVTVRSEYFLMGFGLQFRKYIAPSGN